MHAPSPLGDVFLLFSYGENRTKHYGQGSAFPRSANSLLPHRYTINVVSEVRFEAYGDRHAADKE